MTKHYFIPAAMLDECERNPFLDIRVDLGDDVEMHRRIASLLLEWQVFAGRVPALVSLVSVLLQRAEGEIRLVDGILFWDGTLSPEERTKIAEAGRRDSARCETN